MMSRSTCVHSRSTQALLLLVAGASLFLSYAHAEEPHQIPSVQSYASHATHDDQVASTAPDEQLYEEHEKPTEALRSITTITVAGNKFVPARTILDRLPFKVGEKFEKEKCRTAIHNLYHELGRFRTIDIYGEDNGTDGIDLCIEVEEKKPLKDIIIKGNKQLATKELQTLLDVRELPAIDPEEVNVFARMIQKAYADKGYHQTHVTSEFIVDENDRAVALLTIDESPKALVKRIEFVGNHHVTSKKLRSILYTKEDWIGGLLDKSGTYLAERLEGDKHQIEQLYQNSGYLNAKVTDCAVVLDPGSNSLTLTFDINEGDLYTFVAPKVSANHDKVKNEFLESIIGIQAGHYYSRQAIIDALKRLEFFWGDLGYLYAHFDPSIQPDEETKTVQVTFYCDLGEPVTLNKITIKGNKKSRDKVIRRKISLQEGSLISTSQMEASKMRVESLGYFDRRDGVTWKTVRLSENLADLELVLKEVKTGNAHVKLGFGGDTANFKTPLSGVSAEANFSDSNLFGSGIRLSLDGRLSTNEKTGTLNITQPWLFDKPIYGSMDLYYKRFSYDQLSLTPVVNERHAGSLFTSGLVLNHRNPILQETYIRGSLGADAISYGRSEDGVIARPKAHIPPLFDDPTNVIRDRATKAYDELLARLFEPGKFCTVALMFGQDKKNHPMHPSHGIAWAQRNTLAAPSFDSNIGFFKWDLDVHWYTPLINEYDLVFHLHGYMGVLYRFSKRIVPYRELFHIGGPASVRGFLFGQIGPQFSVVEQSGFIRNDSVGGTRAFFINTELVFPITRDFTMKGLVFYDGGAGWAPPYTRVIPNISEFERQNSFDYRHAVGVGIRLLQPVPLRIDWGFKLDPRTGETGYEVHFGMTYDW